MEGDWGKLLNHYQHRLEHFTGELSLHNAFADLVNASRDLEVVALTRRKYDHQFMIAKELGAKIIISHFHWLPFYRDVYLRKWQDEQIHFWEPYVDRAEKENILLVMENVYETCPEILKPVVDGINSTQFKFIFDIGHAHLFSEVPLEDWLLAFRKDLVYMHVHNNYKNYDQHNSVLEGTINFDYFFDKLDSFNMHPILSTEVFEKKALIESLDYLERKMRVSKSYKLENTTEDFNDN